MARFPPEPEVLSSVKMTRTAYAQLVGQRFHPPKIFGRWAEREGSKDWRWRDAGMKIVSWSLIKMMFIVCDIVVLRRAGSKCYTKKARIRKQHCPLTLMDLLPRYVLLSTGLCPHSLTCS